MRDLRRGKGIYVRQNGGTVSGGRCTRRDLGFGLRPRMNSGGGRCTQLSISQERPYGWGCCLKQLARNVPIGVYPSEQMVRERSNPCSPFWKRALAEWNLLDGCSVSESYRRE